MDASIYRTRAQSAREENEQILCSYSGNEATSAIQRALIGINDARIILNELAATNLEQQVKAKQIAVD
jgi:hypothetical protein